MQATGKFYVEYVGLRMLSRDWRWTAEIFELEDTNRQIAHFQTCVVPWIRKSRKPITFWPAPSSQKSFKGPSARPAHDPIVDEEEPPPDHGVDPLGGGDDVFAGVGCPGPGAGNEDEAWWPEFDTLLAELESERKKGAGAGGSGGGEGAGGGDGDGDGGASSSAPPPPPPPHPEPRPKTDGRGKPRYDHYPILDESGTRIGYFIRNDNAKSFDCHCELHSNDCAFSKSWAPWDPEDGKLTELRASKGRPLAFLVAWLRYGAKWPDTPEGQQAHKDAKLGRGLDQCIMMGHGKLRLDCRAYIEAEPTFEPLRLKERKPRPGEPLEPLGKF